MAEEIWLALSNFPDPETAGRIAEQLVRQKFAACANILPGVRSIYRWKGQVEEATETTVLFKTTRARFAALQAKLQELHPYEVPEVIALPLADGLSDYLRWVAENSAPNE